jgi:tetratricopeptide (TPR) repeat protein
VSWLTAWACFPLRTTVKGDTRKEDEYILGILTMSNMRINRSIGCGTDAVIGRRFPWALLTQNPTDVIFARKTLDQRQFEDAERHLRRALDTDPESAEVWSLMGVLHERLGEHHAAYQSYKLALEIDRRNTIARAGVRRYCAHFGLDFHNKAINPALE